MDPFYIDCRNETISECIEIVKKQLRDMPSKADDSIYPIIVGNINEILEQIIKSLSDIKK